MSTEFSGIERRLDELSDRLARLQPLTDKTRADFEGDPYLRDIVERNLGLQPSVVWISPIASSRLSVPANRLTTMMRSCGWAS